MEKPNRSTMLKELLGYLVDGMEYPDAQSRVIANVSKHPEFAKDAPAGLCQILDIIYDDFLSNPTNKN